jgi:hypothetical protein
MLIVDIGIGYQYNSFRAHKLNLEHPNIILTIAGSTDAIACSRYFWGAVQDDRALPLPNVLVVIEYAKTSFDASAGKIQFCAGHGLHGNVTRPSSYKEGCSQ